MAAMEAQGLAMRNLPHAMQAFRDAAIGGDPAPMTQFLMSEESSSEDGVIIRLLQCELRGNFGNHSLVCCRALLRYDSDGIAYDFLKGENFFLGGLVFIGNVESVAFSLATGANANDPPYMPPLFELAKTVRPSVEVLKLLLRAGALWDSYGWDARDYGVAESGWFCSDWSPVYRAGEHVGPDYRTIEQQLRLVLATAGPFGNGLGRDPRRRRSTAPWAARRRRRRAGARGPTSSPCCCRR